MIRPYVGPDPRVELIAVVEALACGNPCPAGDASAYLALVRRRFDSGHAACRLFSRLTPTDWRHRHPSMVMLDFTLPPGLKVRAYSDHYREAGRDDSLARLLPELRRFAEEHSFAVFFKEQAAFYRRWMGLAREALSRLDYSDLERYLGLSSRHRLHFLLTPLYHGSATHNLLYRRAGGRFDIYSISGHDEVVGGEPAFRPEPREMLRIAWHELAHTIVDDLTQGFARELAPCAPLYGLMRGLARAKYCGPPGWLHMVDEHVIRGLTSRLEALRFGEASGQAALDQERADGFVLVGAVYEALRRYEGDRAAYPTLRHFYPRLVSLFRRLLQRAGLPA